jgi:hypothetical protein
MSISVFCDEMGIDPKRFVGVEVNRVTSTVTLVLEPMDEDATLIQRQRDAAAPDAERLA